MSVDKVKVKFCKKCVVPSSSAVPVAFNSEGVCTACQIKSTERDVDWERRKRKLSQLLNEYKSKDNSNYDCIIPVSGGKDSYFQIHVLKEMGINPLLVTYHGNNYTSTGMKNLKNMREAFGFDHVFFTPAIKTLRKLNRLGMLIMGDMNWHAHAGIFTYPIKVAVEKKIPLMVWGEHGFMDLGGMHSFNDFVEFTYRFRHEHALRGYEWNDFVELAPKYSEELNKRELIPWIYPSDKEIDEVGVRGIYISNYVKWEANEHSQLMIDKYGFLPAEEPFERTYRRMSNLDDMHENGIHDYMKWVKFGYGRATDHVCKDIRAGIMTRKEGLRVVQERDHIKPKDLYRWIEYVGWSEEQFDQVADSFRDPRVWWIDNGEWYKCDAWGGVSSYGKVHLQGKQLEEFLVKSEAVISRQSKGI